MYTSRNFKVILIDDDQQMAEMLKDFFQEKFPSSEISVFHTGEKALDGIFADPDMIVLDYHLDSMDPNAMNGIQVLKKLRDRFAEIPVIFLSGQERAEVAANTMRYGAYDYVVKNENAFHRLEILTKNILGSAELKKNLGMQKFFNYLLAFLIIAMIVGMLIVRVTK